MYCVRGLRRVGRGRESGRDCGCSCRDVKRDIVYHCSLRQLRGNASDIICLAASNRLESVCYTNDVEVSREEEWGGGEGSSEL